VVAHPSARRARHQGRAAPREFVQSPRHPRVARGAPAPQGPAPTRAYAAFGRRSWKARPSTPNCLNRRSGTRNDAPARRIGPGRVAGRRRPATEVTATRSARPAANRRESSRPTPSVTDATIPRKGIKKSSHRGTSLAVADRQDQLPTVGERIVRWSSDLRAPEVNALVSTPLRPGRSGGEPDVRQGRRATPKGQGTRDLTVVTRRKREEDATPVTPRARRGLRCSSTAPRGDIRNLYGTRPYPRFV